MESTEIALRLALATLFGAAIGLERERKNWTAGMRTHMMVCMGSALMMMVSAHGFNEVLGKEGVGLDPSRVAAQVVSGIGFIGAGTILFLKQGVVRGLTTAAGLWTVAGIGLATGGGMYFAAIAATVLALFILWIIQPLEARFAQRFKKKTLRITTLNEEKSLNILNEIFEQEEVSVASCTLERAGKDYLITFAFKWLPNAHRSRLMSRLQSDEAVKEVVWVG